MAIAITFLSVALLNLVHWICTRRSGLLPSPTGVPGLVLTVWFWAAMGAILAAVMQWMSAQVAMSCLLAWAIAKTLCAVWVRQFQKTFGMRKKPAEIVIELARRVQARLTELYGQVGEPEPGSALDQSGLRDGQSIVEDYVSHGEVGLAVEHVIYMVVEPGIRLSGEDHATLESVCRAFGISAHGLLPPPADGS